MIEEIKNHPDLKPFTCSKCRENSIEATIDEEIDNILILKPDDFYNAKKIGNRPPAVDCLILVKCDNTKGYHLYLVELKNINSRRRFRTGNVTSKFTGVVENFLEKKMEEGGFKELFPIDQITKFQCYFVSKIRNMHHDRNLMFDIATANPFDFVEFRERKYPIRSVPPNPMIAGC